MIPRGKKQDEVQICGDDCRYRKLYEGSQRSLTEMASRQAQAVSRVGRLRNQLVLAAKRAFPKAFGEAERSLGKRLSEASDEILVAYLENFMGSSVLAEEPEGASDLRQALGEIGVRIPAGVDLREWAEAVRRYAPEMFKNTTPVLAEKAEPRVMDKPKILSNRDLLIERPTVEVADTDLDLDDLFESEGDFERPVTPEIASTEVSDVRLGAGVPDLPAGHPFEAESHPFESEIEAETTNVVALGDDIFGDFADETIGGANTFPESSGLVVESFYDDSTDTFPAESPAQGAAGTQKGEEGRQDLVESETRPPAEAETIPPSPMPAWQAGRTVKPQLFPPSPAGGRGAKREKRSIRSRAIPADLPDVPVETHESTGEVVLGEATRHQLLAAVSVPRPVFTSDLAGIVGSEELVSAWREELQNGDLTVRFVLPKPRHKQRGSLVIPQSSLAGASSEFSRSHWAKCMEAYRGARIYELGVFFHRFGEQVISFESDGEVVSVRMSLPSGLTGAVLVAGQDLGAGGATRAGLCGSLERLLQDRLVHIAVLVLNAEQFDAVSNVLESEARARNWRASMPVTLSKSWEYVDGTGTAVPLLGV